MKSLLIMLFFLLSGCNLDWSKGNTDLNTSALYDPPEIHLIPGKIYEFEEGTLEGRGQIFHSDASVKTLILTQ